MPGYTWHGYTWNNKGRPSGTGTVSRARAEKFKKKGEERVAREKAEAEEKARQEEQEQSAPSSLAKREEEKPAGPSTLDKREEGQPSSPFLKGKKKSLQSPPLIKGKKNSQHHPPLSKGKKKSLQSLAPLIKGKKQKSSKLKTRSQQVRPLARPLQRTSRQRTNSKRPWSLAPALPKKAKSLLQMSPLWRTLLTGAPPPQKQKAPAPLQPSPRQAKPPFVKG